MKRVLSVVLVVCLLISISSQALAATVEGIEPQYAIGDPTISNVAPTSSDLVAGENTTVRVVIQFTPSQMIESLDCTVKVFYELGPTCNELGRADILINGNEYVYVPVVFPTIGTIQIYAELYSGTTLLAESSRYTVTVKGSWKIESVTPTSNNLVAGEEATVNVAIGFIPTEVIASLDCTVKVFYKLGSTSVELGQADVFVNGCESVDVPVVFPSVGNIQIYAKLYTGTTLLDQSSEYTVAVMGRWKIEIMLPQNRYLEGTLTLYNGNGEDLLQIRCLGLSVGNKPMDAGDGNTPVGDFRAWLVGPDSNTVSYGPHKVVYLDPMDPNGRTNICIHGGRHDSPTATDYALSATNGCIRVTNGHQKMIEDIITALFDAGYHYQVGRVYIREF